MSILNLDRLFAPSSLAVVGASDRKSTIGAADMQNLAEGGFAGKVYPMDPLIQMLPSAKSLPKPPTSLKPSTWFSSPFRSKRFLNL